MTPTVMDQTQWGVRHNACTKSAHVDPRADEVDARRWLKALLFMGHPDAVLVCRGCDHDEWAVAS